MKSRFIPTCVGNAMFSYLFRQQRPVHPHVCGERIWIASMKKANIGSSPRVWGTQFSVREFENSSRFIPTCVGNATNYQPPGGEYAVHPHVCGERTYCKSLFTKQK